MLRGVSVLWTIARERDAAIRFFDRQCYELWVTWKALRARGSVVLGRKARPGKT